MSYSALFLYLPSFVCTAPKPVYSSTVYTAAKPVYSSALQLSQFIPGQWCTAAKPVYSGALQLSQFTAGMAQDKLCQVNQSLYSLC